MRHACSLESTSAFVDKSLMKRHLRRSSQSEINRDTMFLSCDNDHVRQMQTRRDRFPKNEFNPSNWFNFLLASELTITYISVSTLITSPAPQLRSPNVSRMLRRDLWRHHRLCQRKTQDLIHREFFGGKICEWKLFGRREKYFRETKGNEDDVCSVALLASTHAGISQFVVCLTVLLFRHEDNLIPIAFHIGRSFSSVASRIGVDETYTRSYRSIKRKHIIITRNISENFHGILRRCSSTNSTLTFLYENFITLI